MLRLQTLGKRDNQRCEECQAAQAGLSFQSIYLQPQTQASSVRRSSSLEASGSDRRQLLQQPFERSGTGQNLLEKIELKLERHSSGSLKPTWQVIEVDDHFLFFTWVLETETDEEKRKS